MARSGSGPGCLPLARRNARLDAFLRRNTERRLYERIRTCEPCVVVSDSVSRAYMHAVLSDERVYLTEFSPRTLTEAVSFGRVRDIELVSFKVEKVRVLVETGSEPEVMREFFMELIRSDWFCSV